VSAGTEKQIRAHLADGVGILKIAEMMGVGSGTVQRIKRELPRLTWLVPSCCKP